MSKTILLAKDHATCRALAREYLLMEGFDVIEAQNGIEAAHRFDENSGRIDLVILDIIMPGMNGKDVYEKIIQSANPCPVLFCSGYTGDKLGTQFRLTIKNDILVKPYKGEELVARAKEILGIA